MPNARLMTRIAAVGLLVSLVGVAMWWRTGDVARDEPVSTVQPKVTRPVKEATPLSVTDAPSDTRPEAPPVDSPAWMPAELRVLVRTETDQPVAHARVESDCGWAARTDSAGKWVQLLSSGTCNVWAVREDGLLRVLSNTKQVTLEAGVLVEASLLLPSETQGGIGVAVEPHPGGVRVRALRPDAPAIAAGLVPGAVVLEVDGRSTRGWQAEDFADAVIGPLGTPVVLTLDERDTGGGTEVALIRTWLSPGSTAERTGGVSLASLSDDQRREVAAIRDALNALDDGSGLDLDSPQVQELAGGAEKMQ